MEDEDENNDPLFFNAGSRNMSDQSTYYTWTKKRPIKPFNTTLDPLGLEQA